MKRKILLGLAAIIVCCSFQVKGLKATEMNKKESEQNTQVESQTNKYVNNVLLETDTSIVYDMDNIPAIQQNVDLNPGVNPLNSYNNLKVPAQITRHGEYYFIVDCYNNQVLYSKNIGEPLKKWRVLTSKVNYPHAIASDGQVYLVADTDNHRVMVFEWRCGRFQNTQTFENIGVRPHYIQYDPQTDAFFAWSSMTGDMYILKRDANTGVMYIKEIRHIKELENFYVRSFTIAGDMILFPSGNNCNIIVADKNTLEVRWRYPVTQEISGMAYIQPIGNYFYMTVSSDLSFNQDVATIIRTKDLATLAQGQYEDVYKEFHAKGVPYYIDYINGMYYMTNHGSSKSIYRFNVIDDIICNVGAVY